MKNKLTLSSLFALALLALPAQAQIVETNVSSTTSESVYDSKISTTKDPAGNTGTDLVYNRPATLTAGLTNAYVTAGSTLAPETGSAASFVDGTTTSGAMYTTTSNVIMETSVIGSGYRSLQADPTFTVALNTAADPKGFTLSEVDVFEGFKGQSSYADQNYSIYYSTVAAPTVFTLLDTVSYMPFNPHGTNGQADGDAAIPGSSLVTLTNITGITGVADIKMVLSPGYYGGTIEQDGQDMRELEVFGTATIPEPSAFMLIGGGLGLLGFCLRLKRALLS